MTNYTFPKAAFLFFRLQSRSVMYIRNQEKYLKTRNVTNLVDNAGKSKSQFSNQSPDLSYMGNPGFFYILKAGNLI